ncbi:MAG: hypothetical protein ACOYKO_00665 [Rhodoluna sp.]
MLLLASIALASSSWAAAPSCPSSFSSVSTTIGAVSNSSQLTLCVSKALLVKGSNGSLNLVLGAQTSTAPKCLVYPNGLSLDLTHSLLSSGHVGCWSLYPPYQAIAIVNVGRPTQVKLQSALRAFKPEIPKIFLKPSKGIQVGEAVYFSSSTRTQILKARLLGLAAQIRFKPTKYKWSFVAGSKSKTSSAAKPTYVPSGSGDVRALLAVSYSVEYLFEGVTSWNLVKPDLVVNANQVTFSVGSVEPPKSGKEPPKLVNSPCSLGSAAWRC